jgi:hypothetical protein
MTGNLKKHNIIKDTTPIQVSLEKLDNMLQHPMCPKLGRYLFAANARTQAKRAEKLWGYKGTAPGLLECLEEDFLDTVGGI